MNEQELRTNKQELISKYELLKNGYNFNVVAIDGIISDLKRLDEPEKVKIPQFVAEIIEYYKGQNATLYDALREKNFNKQYSEWLLNEQNAYNKVARAWLDGYEVEKEKRYLVKLRNNNEEIDYLVDTKSNGLRFYSTIYTKNRTHTRTELEEAGFGWVFSCEGVEVEEVEE
jgi:phage protein